MIDDIEPKYTEGLSKSILGAPSKYKQDMCQAIIELAKGGLSALGRSVEIGICEGTYYEWINPTSPQYHLEFHEAHIVAEGHEWLFFERLGLTYIVEEPNGKKLNANVFRLQMMNRFLWSISTNNKNDNTNTNTIITITDGAVSPLAPDDVGE